MQALSLIGLSRLLGVEGYGTIAGSVALFGALAPFVGAGSGVAYVRMSALDPKAAIRLYGITLKVYAITGLIAVATLWPVACFLFSGLVPATALLYLAIAELAITPLLLPASYRYQSSESFGPSSFLLSAGNILRLASVAIALVIGLDDIISFSATYLICIGVGTCVLLVAFHQRAHEPPKSSETVGKLLKMGLPYAASGAAVATNSEFDKAAVLKLCSASQAGAYAAAYRLSLAAILPINSLLHAAAPRLFKSAGRSSAAPLLAVSMGYGVAAGSAIWLLAPYLPILLGPEFAESIDLMRWICLLIPVACLRQVIGGLLTTSNLQSARVTIEWMAVLASISLMLVLIPDHGPYGAMVAIAASDTFTLAAGALALRINKSHSLI